MTWRELKTEIEKFDDSQLDSEVVIFDTQLPAFSSSVSLELSDNDYPDVICSVKKNQPFLRYED